MTKLWYFDMIMMIMVLNACLCTQNLTDNAFEILIKLLNFNKHDSELKFIDAI